MAQNDFSIANQGFPSFRSDLNDALQSLASNSSGTTAPPTTYAYQWWYDETSDILKMRNSANDDWIEFATFDQTTDSWSFTSADINGDLTVDTDTLFVDASTDRVGIGTSSPATNLDIAAASASTLTVRNTDTVSSILLSNGSATNQIFSRGADSSTGRDLAFVQGNTERMRIDSSGNVGIGTSSPSAALDVRSSDTIISELDGRNASNTAEVIVRSNGGAGNNTRGRIIGGYDAGGSGFGGFLAFNTTSTSNVNSEAMRIDSSGNVLVGTTSTGINNSDAAVFRPNTGGSYVAQLEGGNVSVAVINRHTSNGQAIRFLRDNSDVGSISVTSSATSYNTSSDYRLKEDVQPMSGAADRLMNLKPVNFAWKVDGTRVDGFLAHEAQEVIPEAVTGEKDAVDDGGNPEYQGIDQSKLVPVLTAALQEALQRIEALEAQRNP